MTIPAAIPGTLFVVATPIGNRGDFSPRAIDVLKTVSVIACEDTRHSGSFLRGFSVGTQRVSLHEHNEQARVAELIARLLSGDGVALISDAGTPLISDPGYRLVREAHAAGVTVSPVPGASAMLAALSAAGMATDRFSFEGFLTAKRSARLAALELLKNETRTMIFYESPRRLLAALTDCAEIFGQEREACIARELTKQFETVKKASLGRLLEWVSADQDQQRGEIVLVVAGRGKASDVAVQMLEADLDIEKLMRALLQKLRSKDAAQIAAAATGLAKNDLYALALKIGDENG